MALVRTESGCKVGWYYYDNPIEAREMAKRAAGLAASKASEGYDFGYQVPGEIKEIADTASDQLLWCVTVP